MIGIQEPEIYEQPVGSANKDPESAVHEEQTYATLPSYATNGGLQTITTGDSSTSEDFHLFVYPEGMPFPYLALGALSVPHSSGHGG